ncbi:MAG: glutathione S-transferase family protein [Acaryochloridaceae cyanobacterium RU_4_10]|nr:glutathione S-transferase family protein [Acaryochloridaceae cyanobacterium RU_4_10]
MIKLYGGARSRASIVKWYLEELQIPYEFVQLDMQAGEHKQPEFLAINPMGKVPALTDGDFSLWESGAILLYLAQKYDPTYPTTPEKQAELYQWVLFANATLSTGVFVESVREKEGPQLLTPLSDRLQQQTFMLGESFSVVDVAVGSVLAYIPMMLKLDLSPYPGVIAYNQRLAERPAFQKAMGRG